MAEFGARDALLKNVKGPASLGDPCSIDDASGIVSVKYGQQVIDDIEDSV